MYIVLNFGSRNAFCKGPSMKVFIKENHKYRLMVYQVFPFIVNDSYTIPSLQTKTGDDSTKTHISGEQTCARFMSSPRRAHLRSGRNDYVHFRGAHYYHLKWLKYNHNPRAMPVSFSLSVVVAVVAIIKSLSSGERTTTARSRDCDDDVCECVQVWPMRWRPAMRIFYNVSDAFGKMFRIWMTQNKVLLHIFEFIIESVPWVGWNPLNLQIALLGQRIQTHTHYVRIVRHAHSAQNTLE